MSEWKKIPGVSDWKYNIDLRGTLLLKLWRTYYVFSLKSEAPAAAKFFADYAAGKLDEEDNAE